MSLEERALRKSLICNRANGYSTQSTGGSVGGVLNPKVELNWAQHQNYAAELKFETRIMKLINFIIQYHKLVNHH